MENREHDLFYMKTDFSDEMKHFVNNMNIEFEKGNIAKALEYFSFGLALYEYHPDMNSKHALLINGTKCAVFFKHLHLIESQLERTISYESFRENYEILSVCYYMKSVLNMEKDLYKEAIENAKLAYYYSQLICTNKEFFECNAKLQLICSFILGKDIKSANYFIKEFNWYKDNCLVHSELILLSSIEASIQFVLNKGIGYETILCILQRLKKSNEIMYTTYIVAFFKKVLLKYKNNDSVVNLCDEILSKYMEEEIKIDNRFPYFPLLNSKEFYQKGEEWLSKHKLSQKELYLYKAEISNSNHRIDANFIDAMNIIDKLKINMLVHNYANHKFALLLTQPIESLPIYPLMKFLRIQGELKVNPINFASFQEVYHYLTLSILENSKVGEVI